MPSRRGEPATSSPPRISGGNPIIAKIASIVIKGAVIGREDGTDHFGFVAEHIVAFSSGGLKSGLTRGPSNDIAAVCRAAQLVI
jgi:hypothetical protein